MTSGWWNAITSPLDFTLDNYETVLERQRMARSFLNSLIITIPSTLLVILIAALAAYAFAWMQFPFRNLLFLIVVALAGGAAADDAHTRLEALREHE